MSHAEVEKGELRETFAAHACHSHVDFVVSAHYEYCDIGDGRRWHLLSGDDVYVAVTNVDRSADIALWTNTNTLYSTAAQ